MRPRTSLRILRRAAPWALACLLAAAPAAADRLFRTNFSLYPSANPTTGSGFFATVADVNKDGRADLLNVRQYNSPIQTVVLEVRLGAPGGELSPTLSTWPLGLRQDFGAGLGAADLDNDQDVDVFVAAVDTVSILPNLGAGTFGAPVRIRVPNCQDNGIAAGDFNEVGDPDLVVASITTESVRKLVG